MDKTAETQEKHKLLTFEGDAKIIKIVLQLHKDKKQIYEVLYVI